MRRRGTTLGAEGGGMTERRVWNAGLPESLVERA
jgi:hypothetical protein